MEHCAVSGRRLVGIQKIPLAVRSLKSRQHRTVGSEKVSVDSIRTYPSCKELSVLEIVPVILILHPGSLRGVDCSRFVLKIESGSEYVLRTVFHGCSRR